MKTTRMLVEGEYYCGRRFACENGHQLEFILAEGEYNKVGPACARHHCISLDLERPLAALDRSKVGKLAKRNRRRVIHR